MTKGRPFAAFDIDGTLIRWQLYHAITDAFAKLGHIDNDDHQAIRETRLKWKRRQPGSSFKDYETQVVKTYQEALKNLQPSEVDKAVDLVFDEYKDQIYTYTRQLITDLKSKNYFLLAISGSQTEIVAKIAAHYGFEDYVGTYYEHQDNKYTGKVTVGSFYKGKVLKEMVKKHNLSWQDSVAIGDSHSDVAMLELVQQPIAFNPEKQLYDIAIKQGWKIVIERKNIIYELEKRGQNYELVKTSS
jgi:HAD superfamily hydrolase (TIGR01490 family)